MLSVACTGEVVFFQGQEEGVGEIVLFWEQLSDCKAFFFFFGAMLTIWLKEALLGPLGSSQCITADFKMGSHRIHLCNIN